MVPLLRCQHKASRNDSRRVTTSREIARGTKLVAGSRIYKYCGGQYNVRKPENDSGTITP